MGFNDFHKGFVNRSTEQNTNAITKKIFGARSVEEIIQDRYRKRIDQVPEQPKVQASLPDYQQNMRSQRNLRNLDK